MVGEGRFKRQADSPAWRALACGTTLGFETQRPWSAAAHNLSSDSHFRTHVVVADPVPRKVFEATRRKRDGVWVIHFYHPVGRQALEFVEDHGPTDLGPLRSSLPESRGWAQISEELLAQAIRAIGEQSHAAM